MKQVGKSPAGPISTNREPRIKLGSKEKLKNDKIFVREIDNIAPIRLVVRHGAKRPQ